MKFPHFNQRMLAVGLMSFTLFITSCGGNKDKGEVIVKNSSGDIRVAGANDNSNRVVDSGEASSNEFEGTAGVTRHESYKGGPVLLREIRTAEQNGFDRVVFEFDRQEVPNYKVDYIDKPVRQCGSGEAVEVAGDGWLEVTFTPANAHTEAGRPTIADRERRLSLSILKELEVTCDFEAEVTVVLGVSSPNRYRVLNLTDPARIVLDIKHKNR